MSNQATTLPISALSALQLNFLLLKLDGQIRVIEKHEMVAILCGNKNSDISFYKKNEGELLMKRFLEAQPIASDVKNTIIEFWKNQATHVIDEIAFSPRKLPSTTLNYWIPPLINPQIGQWDLIRSYLKDVICDGDARIYDYLIKYLAHMVQHPEEKPGVMIILLGRQGTGKGMFFQLLVKIWPLTTLLLSDISQVVGQFNAALERNYVICMDEAIFSGDRKSQDRLKSLVTEKTLRIEQKYQPSRSIESIHRIFAASNHHHFSQTESDDRRSLFIRVSASRQNDHIYFSQLSTAINDDAVIGAMLKHLIDLDLSTFNIRSRPLTKEHNKQKMLSLSGFDRYWYEVLCRGRFMVNHIYSSSSFDKSWQDDEFASSNSLLEGYKAFDKNAQRFQTVQIQEITEALKRLCPSATRHRASLNNTQVRGFILPPLTVARSEFERAFSAKVDWEEL